MEKRFLTVGICICISLLGAGFFVKNRIFFGLAGAASALALTLYAYGEFQKYQSELKRKDDQIESLTGLARNQKTAVDAFAAGLKIGIFVCDQRAQIEYANEYAETLFGFQTPYGRSILAVTLSVDLEQLVLQAPNSTQPVETEIVFSFPKERICTATAWTAAETPNRVYLSLFEVTDLRHMERIRRDFVANVSHELRTPMTVIRAYAETMQDDDDPELKDRYLARIISEVDRLSSITQDLLILSSSESSPVRKNPCDMAEIVRYTYNLLLPTAKEKGLEMDLTCPKSLVIEANSSQMTQVVVNLVENALKYTHEGFVKVMLTDRGDKVRVDVADSGIGVAEEHLPRLFERFYRVDKGRSRNSGGTGLGLSIVKHIVEAHGGSIFVDSDLNQGSTFSIELPKGEVEDD